MASTQDTSTSVKFDLLYTVAEAQIILKIGPTKCWALIRNKSLRAVRFGKRCTRITGASLSSLAAYGCAD